MTTRTKAILSLSGTFLIGAICGALLLGIVVRDRVRQGDRLRDPKGFREYFVDRLELTEAQRDSLQGELETAYENLSELRQAVSDEYNEVLDSLVQQLNPVLSREQRALLQEQKAQLLERAERKKASAQRGATPPLQTEPTQQQTPEETPRKKQELPQGPQTTTSEKMITPSGPQQQSIIKQPLTEQLKDEIDSTVQDDIDGFIETVTERYRTRLNLDEQQTTQVQALVKKIVEKNTQAREQLSDYPMLLRAALGRHLKQLDKGIHKLLKPEQIAAYEEMRKEFRAKLKSMGERQPHRKRRKK